MDLGTFVRLLAPVISPIYSPGSTDLLINAGREIVVNSKIPTSFFPSLKSGDFRDRRPPVKLTTATDIPILSTCLFICNYAAQEIRATSTDIPILPSSFE
jgi:hypothetical protein